MALPKWTDERTDALVLFVGDESPISQETVSDAAGSLETSTRSISSKLRKMGYEVDLVSAGKGPRFTEDQAATLSAFVQDNSSEYTYAQIAEHFEDGTFDKKEIQGKILSMELTDHVKPAPKVATVRTYSEEEEEQFIEMVNDGAFVEQIAEALNRKIPSVRGKALSLLRAGVIDAIPRQETTKGTTKEDPLEGINGIADMSVEAIAEVIGKTPRGVKTMLTRRGLVAKDYDGAARKEKAVG
jgi:hypothetical protein